jgi:hypothetical protein
MLLRPRCETRAFPASPSTPGAAMWRAAKTALPPFRGARPRRARPSTRPSTTPVASGRATSMSWRGTSPGPRPHSVFVSNLRYACALAEARGIGILIEPLNRHDAPGYFLRTTDQAVAIMDEVGHDTLRLMFDIYHVQRTEGDLTRRLGRPYAEDRTYPVRVRPRPGPAGWGRGRFRARVRCRDEAGIRPTPGGRVQTGGPDRGHAVLVAPGLALGIPSCRSPG